MVIEWRRITTTTDLNGSRCPIFDSVTDRLKQIGERKKDRQTEVHDLPATLSLSALFLSRKVATLPPAGQAPLMSG
jgi:hypothetical protein